MAREEEVISQAPAGTGRGLEETLARLAPPRAGHISVCCPWPCSEFSDGTKASAAPDSRTPTSACGGRESRDEEAGRERERERAAQRAEGCCWRCTPAESYRTARVCVCVCVCVILLTLGFLRELLMRQAGSAPSHLSLASRGDRGGRSVCRSSSVCDFILQLLNTGTVL